MSTVGQDKLFLLANLQSVQKTNSDGEKETKRTEKKTAST